MEVYNLEKVQCPVCKNTWFTNILTQPCLYSTERIPHSDFYVDYYNDRVKDAA